MSNGHPKGVEYKRIRSDKILSRFETFLKRKNMIWSDPFGDKRQKKSQVDCVEFQALEAPFPNYELRDDFFGIFLAKKFEHQ